MRKRILVFMLAALCCASLASAGMVYDAADDFSATSNVSGVWSYTYAPTDWPGVGGSQLFGHTEPVPGYSYSNCPVTCWCKGDSGWSEPAIGMNLGDTPFEAYSITWDPHVLTMCGNWWAETPGLMWTCPQDGLYDIAATFTAIQDHDQSYWLVNKDLDPTNFPYWIAAGAKGSSGTYTAEMALTAGEKITFMVYGPQWTAVDARISVVPEPGTMALLCTGVIGLLAFAWRKRK
jgi:hypothetical protein